jgi:hypothetical protein
MGVTTPKHFNIKFCQKLSTLKSFRLKFFMVNESTITRTLFLKVKTIPNNQTIFFFFLKDTSQTNSNILLKRFVIIICSLWLDRHHGKEAHNDCKSITITILVILKQ